MLTRDERTGGAQVHLTGAGDTDETFMGCMGARCSEGMAEARRGCKSQGHAQVKFEERHSCYGWGLSPGRGRRGRSSRGKHLTGPRGSGASRLPAQHPPPSPVPAPAAHGACLGQMPAGSNRERPKLFGSCEEEEPVLLPAHPPSPSVSSHLPAERRGGGWAGRAPRTAQWRGHGRKSY